MDASNRPIHRTLVSCAGDLYGGVTLRAAQTGPSVAACGGRACGLSSRPSENEFSSVRRTAAAPFAEKEDK